MKGAIFYLYSILFALFFILMAWRLRRLYLKTKDGDTVARKRERKKIILYGRLGILMLPLFFFTSLVKEVFFVYDFDITEIRATLLGFIITVAIWVNIFLKSEQSPKSDFLGDIVLVGIIGFLVYITYLAHGASLVLLIVSILGISAAVGILSRKIISAK